MAYLRAFPNSQKAFATVPHSDWDELQKELRKEELVTLETGSYQTLTEWNVPPGLIVQGIKSAPFD